MEDLYPQMICRLNPWPEPVTRAFRLGNEKIYNQMQGKSEFEVTGNLKDWERWDRLNEIRVKRSPLVRIMTRWTLPICVKWQR